MKFIVCQTLGTGYSGSSILNLMLDSIQGVRGLGEICLIYDKSYMRPCSLCQSSDNDRAHDCHFYDGMKADTFYSDCFRRYPDAHTLVDTSKLGAEYPRGEKQFYYKNLYLLKWPHEFVAGLVFRNSNLSIKDRFEMWLEMNERELEIAHGALVVPYRSFVLQPDAALMSICDFLQIPFTRREDWWATTTHIIGGNWSVRAQMNKNYEYYLHDVDAKKYNGQFHQIFLDEAWRTMPQVREESIRLYKHYRKRCDAIFNALQLPSTEAMIADIEGSKIGYISPNQIVKAKPFGKLTSVARYFRMTGG